jgi:hypothetical protein
MFSVIEIEASRIIESRRVGRRPSVLARLPKGSFGIVDLPNGVLAKTRKASALDREAKKILRGAELRSRYPGLFRGR